MNCDKCANKDIKCSWCICGDMFKRKSDTDLKTGKKRTRIDFKRGFLKSNSLSLTKCGEQKTGDL